MKNTKKPEKLSLALLPTPIIKLEILSKELGKNLWMKRDDMTGIELSGNKVRKLEYIFNDILRNKCDYALTCGGKQSNHCRAVAAVAAKFGVKCVLFLSGEDDGSCEANLFLSKIFGAETVFVPQDEYINVEKIMNDAAEELSDKGHRPYVIPMGGSTSLGAAGYVDAYNEIADFENLNSIRFDIISLAVGSVGTFAGIIAGNEMNGHKSEILGISVLADSNYVEEKTNGLCSEMGISYAKFSIIDKYVAPGYGIAGEGVYQFIKKFASEEGIILDPVYTGKALHGLVSELKSGVFDSCSNILFIHTGGVFGIFPHVPFFNL